MQGIMSELSKTPAAIKPTNNFDFLRLVFACGVFVFHAVILSNIWAGSAIEPALAYIAEISIQGFFIISGMLVYGSLVNSNGIKDYFGKRIRRLYPAYFIVILAPAIISLILTGQFTNVLRYLGANLAFLNFLEPNLPGLFEGQRHSAVNGALWTLKIEVMFYLALPILGFMLARLDKLKWALLTLIYIAAEIWRSQIPGMQVPHVDQIARQLPGQMSFFAVGIALWIVKDIVRKHAIKAGLVGLTLVIISFLQPFEFIRALGIGGMVAGIAFAHGFHINAARWGDISYGVYITHFPIVNALVALGAFAISPWLGLTLAAVSVFVASLLLWKFVERPFLRRDSHYRQAEK